MIKINNENVDLVLQVEEHTSLDKVFEYLSLDINQVLIIAPSTFIQRFTQTIYEELTEANIDNISLDLEQNGFTCIEFNFKGKEFTFYFIILTSETKTINNPFKGEQIFNIGLKRININ